MAEDGFPRILKDANIRRLHFLGRDVLYRQVLCQKAVHGLVGLSAWRQKLNLSSVFCIISRNPDGIYRFLAFSRNKPSGPRWGAYVTTTCVGFTLKHFRSLIIALISVSLAHQHSPRSQATYPTGAWYIVCGKILRQNETDPEISHIATISNKKCSP